MAREVRNHFEGLVFHAMVPRNVRIGESPSHGLPVMLYDPSSSGAEAYRKVAKELLEQVLTQSSAEVPGVGEGD